MTTDIREFCIPESFNMIISLQFLNLNSQNDNTNSKDVLYLKIWV